MNEWLTHSFIHSSTQPLRAGSFPFSPFPFFWIIFRIILSPFSRLSTLQTRLVALAREFNDARNAPAFFPVAFLVRRCEEVAITAGKTGDALGEWITQCFLDCGVEYEQLVHVTRDVAETGVQSRWIVNAIWVFAKWVKMGDFRVERCKNGFYLSKRRTLTPWRRIASFRRSTTSARSWET